MSASSVRTEQIELPVVGPGTRRTLTVLGYGEPGARPKAYLQASVHADEVPAMLALNRLAVLLDDAAAEGRVSGEIVLVPAANPIGLSQHVNGRFCGRYALDGSGNFNRGYPDLSAGAAARGEG